MKRFVWVVTLSLLAAVGFAQKHERSVTAIEVEPSIGMYRGFMNAAIEARYNFHSPWDVGLRECLDYMFSDGGGTHVTYDVVGDYNFRRGKNVSIFAGAGVGLTVGDYYDINVSAYKRNTIFHFMPRVGVELMNRVRLTCYANTFGDKDKTGSVGLSAGFAFGGGRMENRDYNIQHFEFEPFLGVSSGAFLLGWEARYNFNSPWDVGLNFAGDFNGERITAVGDYLFLQRKRTTLFCGLGAGWANTRILNIDETIDEYGDACVASSDPCLCIYPRVGVEFFQHLRLTAALNTYNMKKAELAITLGVAICGGKRE